MSGFEPLCVRVGATSANLGSGFDALGLCLDWYDEISCAPSDTLEVTVVGEGAGTVPRDGSNVVVTALRRGLIALGADPAQPVALTCTNTIPHARGLGSSAAAVAAGLALAWGIARPNLPVDRLWVAELASQMEGHPDNAFPAALGGAVVAWRSSTPDGHGPGTEHLMIDLDPRITARVWIPDRSVPTSLARGVLTDTVSRRDAVAQAVALALLVRGLTSDPQLLWEGTRDRLHQDARAPLMPESAALVALLREAGVAAAISGAGSAVVALGTAEQLRETDAVGAPGFVVRTVGVGEPLRLSHVQGGEVGRSE